MRKRLEVYHAQTRRSSGTTRTGQPRAPGAPRTAQCLGRGSRRRDQTARSTRLYVAPEKLPILGRPHAIFRIDRENSMSGLALAHYARLAAVVFSASGLILPPPHQSPSLPFSLFFFIFLFFFLPFLFSTPTRFPPLAAVPCGAPPCFAGYIGMNVSVRATCAPPRRPRPAQRGAASPSAAVRLPACSSSASACSA